MEIKVPDLVKKMYTNLYLNSTYYKYLEKKDSIE